MKLATWHWHINILTVVKENGFTSYNTDIEIT